MITRDPEDITKNLNAQDYVNIESKLAEEIPSAQHLNSY